MSLSKKIAAPQTKTTAQWCEQFRELGIRYAPVRDYAGAAADPQVWDNGYLQEIVTPKGAQKVVACPISMSDTPLQPAGLPPELGEHTQQILADLGYSDDEIVALQESGSV